MKTASILFLIFAAAGAVMAGWHFRTTTIAYRITLEVRVNGETHTGSGVVATDWARNANPLAAEQGGWAFHDRGEAVTVDLGRYGLLFLTTQGRWGTWQLPMAVYGNGGQNLSFGDYIRSLHHPRPSVEIPHSSLPLLVRFRDITQPSTAECVDPDNMAASFPPATDVTLVHATLGSSTSR